MTQAPHVTGKHPLMTRAFVAACCLLAVMAISCTKTSTSVAQTGTATASIHSFAFAPHALSVPVGTTVTWTNQDDITHTVTSGTPGMQGTPGVSENVSPEPDGAFDEQLAGAGATATVTLDRAGTFTYFCRIHPGMTGEVTVT